MTVKRRGPRHGFHAKAATQTKLRIREPVTDSGASALSSRQVKPEEMFAWTGISVKSLSEIPKDCICDWIHHTGVLEIKYFNGLCSVRHPS